ncbi:winged helix-turn-helix domain-containing protein [Teichococcus aestuarii]
MMLRDPSLTAERDMIAEHVLGYRRRPQQRGVDQFASSLRQKLEQSSNGAIQLLAVRGRGYRLVW